MTRSTKRSGRARRPSPLRRAFTLLEVLLAASLTVVIGLAVAGILQVQYTARERVRARGEQRAVLAAVERRLAADLRAIVPPGGVHAAGVLAESATRDASSEALLDPVLDAAADSYRAAAATAAEAAPPVDERDRLTLAVNTAPPEFGDSTPLGEGALVSVVYEVDDDPETEERGLVRRATRLREPVPGAEAEPPEQLAEWVVGLDLRFWDGAAWQETWDSGASDTLPLAIEARLACAVQGELFTFRVVVAPPTGRPSQIPPATEE